MIVGLMQKRILLLPLIWGIFGISDVLAVNYLFGSVVNSLPYPPNDKPIGGSFLPVLAFNAIAYSSSSDSAYTRWASGISTGRTEKQELNLSLLEYCSGV